MSKYRTLDSEMYALTSRMDSLGEGALGDSDSFLGFGWPTMDGQYQQAKWAYHNWDELVTRFALIPSNKDIRDITGETRVSVMDPITGMRETRRVIKPFAQFITTNYERADRKMTRSLERVTERGYRPAHDSEDTVEGQKDSVRVWGYKKSMRV